MDINHILGGSPLGVILRLVVISIIVGIVLAAFGLQPLDLLNNLQILIVRLYEMGFKAIDWVFAYFLLGAAIVIPIWFIVRMFALFSRKKDNQ